MTKTTKRKASERWLVMLEWWPVMVEVEVVEKSVFFFFACVFFFAENSYCGFVEECFGVIRGFFLADLEQQWINNQLMSDS